MSKCSPYRENDLRNLLSKIGGQLHSINWKTRTILFTCRNNHTNQTILINSLPACVKNNRSGCKICSKEQLAKRNSDRAHSESEIHDLCTSLNGLWISGQYKDVHSKLTFMCKYGHIFTQTFNIVKNSKRWCKQCSNTNICERYAHIIVETLFQTRFQQRTRSILSSKLELDIYSDELNIAFEYNGKQHYTTVEYFRVNNERLQEIQKRDQQKQKECKDLGIILICIPYTYNKFTTILEYITTKLSTTIYKQYIIPELHDWAAIEIFARSTPKGTYNLQFYNDHAVKNNGILLSTSIGSIYEPLIFKCMKGHIFQKTPSNIKGGQKDKTWCSKCSNKARITNKELNNLVTSLDMQLVDVIRDNSKGTNSNLIIVTKDDNKEYNFTRMQLGRLLKKHHKLTTISLNQIHDIIT